MDEYEYLQLVKSGEITLHSYISKFRPGSSAETIVDDLLEHGIGTESDKDVLCALACFNLTETYSSRFIDMINRLCLVTWHNRHDDLCTILQKYGDSKSIPYLEFMIYHPPSIHDSDEPFSVGNRAVHSIYYIDGPEAIESLKRIASSQPNSIGATAKRFLGEMIR